MTDKANDGPAFPFNEKEGDGTHYHSHAGMTLRDYFAIRAPEYNERWFGWYCKNVGFTSDEATRAAWNYQYADAMLAARSAS